MYVYKQIAENIHIQRCTDVTVTNSDSQICKKQKSLAKILIDKMYKKICNKIIHK